MDEKLWKERTRLFKEISNINTIIEQREQLVACPFCGCENVHICSVKINNGGKITKIDSERTTMEAGEPIGRGAKIEITFHCEEWHMWTQSFQFHKGQTIIKNFLVTLPESFPTLWRD